MNYKRAKGFVGHPNVLFTGMGGGGGDKNNGLCSFRNGEYQAK